MNNKFNELARLFFAGRALVLADLHAVALAAPRFGESDPERMLGLAFAVHAPRDGHAGIELGEVQARHEALAGAEPASSRSEASASASSDEADDTHEPASQAEPPALPWPDAAGWQDLALGSPMVGDPADPTKPFVSQRLEHGKRLLLTRRMYVEQERIAVALAARAVAPIAASERIDIDAALGSLFPGDHLGEGAQAVRLAAGSRLTFIIGGPGTGKTFSITRLLAALLEQDRGDRPLQIALAAPTGKAAARMREAIREATASGAKPLLEVSDAVRAKLQALEAKTLHSLLGVRPEGGAYRSKENPLAADVVVVDEASMIDLTLMRYLVEAVSPSARLVLLGDRDQLASVEAGSVLSDVVGDGQSGPLASHTAALTRSHRFESAPDIAHIAACLQSHASRQSDIPSEPAHRLQRAIDVFMGRAHAAKEEFSKQRVTHLEPADGAASARVPTSEQLEALAAPYLEGFTELGSSSSPKLARKLEGYASLIKRYYQNGHWGNELSRPEVQREVLSALDRYRILAVHRRGPLGVEGLNRTIGDRVRSFIDAGDGGSLYWVGRPVLITENAYDIGLMNGDVGLILLGANGKLAAIFPHERPGEVRSIALSRLPPHETALALTVHKSQGSQFDRVALVLAGRPSPIQTRELVYTGVTRAKNQLAWLGSEEELRGALGNRVTRYSGLSELLREAVGARGEARPMGGDAIREGADISNAIG